MGLPNFREMREQCERMRVQKNAAFPKYSMVQVDTDRFHGIGFVDELEGCPLEKLAVRVESLNIWWYPIEDCKPYNGKMPTWLNRYAVSAPIIKHLQDALNGKDNK